MGKYKLWFLLFILCIAMAPAANSQGAVLRAQPELLAMSREMPTTRVKIIVQKSTTDQGLEALVERLGGAVTMDLSIINAFAADVPASIVPTLAAAASVRWISLDAPMQQSGGSDGAVNTANLLNVYNKAIRADALWAQGYQGSSVGVAVVDSAIDEYAADLNGRIAASW